MGASEGLQRLCKACGADWLQKKILPRIHGFYDDSAFYLIRIAILNALKKLANGEVSYLLLPSITARSHCKVEKHIYDCRK